MIPNFRKPYSDEHLFGWVLELAVQNGGQPSSFIPYFFDATNVPYYSSHIRCIRIDFIAGLNDIYDRYRDDALFPKPEDIIYDQTVYPMLFPFYSYGEQAGLVNNMLNIHIGSEVFIPHIKHKSYRLRFCPECIKSDMENGIIPYIRTWHQMRSVTICPIHGCEIYYIPYNLIKASNASDYIQTILSEIKPMPHLLERDAHISNFFYDLYKNPPAIDRSVLQIVLAERLRDLGLYPKHSESVIQQYIKDAGYSDYTFDSSTITKYLINKGHSLKCVDAMLPCFFDDYTTFQSYLTGYTISLDEHPEIFEPHYKLISSRGVLSRLLCQKCGHDFTVHAKGIALGVGCPHCDMKYSPEEVVSRQLALSSHGPFKLISPFNGYGSKADIVHEACGQVKHITPFERIFGEVACSCQNELTVEDAQKAIDRTSDGYTVLKIESESGHAPRLVIKHTECGGTFKITLKNFQIKGVCRCCDNKPLSEHQKEIDRIAPGKFRLLGMRIIYEGLYKPSVAYLLQHIGSPSCKPFVVKVSAFKESPFCRICNEGRSYSPPKYTDDDLQIMINEAIAEKGITESFTLIKSIRKKTTNRTDLFLRLKHSKCGKEFTIEKNVFLNYPKCHVCSPDNKTTMEYAQKRIDGYRKGFTVKSFRFNEKGTFVYTLEHTAGCGKEFTIGPSVFKNDTRCRCCEINRENNKIPHTITAAQNFIDLIAPEHYEVLSVTKGKPPMYELRCRTCNQVFKRNYYSMNNDSRCRCCELPLAEAQARVDNVIPDRFEVISVHGDIFTLKCRKCHQDFEIKFPTFKAKPKCRKCETVLDCMPLTIEKAQEKVNAVRPGFKVLNIIGEPSKRSLILFHEECGGTFTIKLYSFQHSGGRCKVCKKSSGLTT